MNTDMIAFRRLTLLLCLVTGACAGQSVSLVGKTSGLTSHSTFPVQQSSNEVKFAFGKFVFVGRWSYFHGVAALDDQGGQLETKKKDKQDKDQVVAAQPNGGVGSFFGSTRDGAVLHCTFSYNEGRLKGLGRCEDNFGEMYDLSIN